MKSFAMLALTAAVLSCVGCVYRPTARPATSAYAAQASTSVQLAK